MLRLSPRIIASFILLSAAALLPGCLRRTIEITSTPPGALVWLNDVEVGRTPLEVAFTHYGAYDVRLSLPGYEPVVTHRSASSPVYEVPPIDLGAEAIPADIHNVVRWHFDLQPRPEDALSRDQFESEFIARARALREQLTVAEPSAPASSAPTPAPEPPRP